MSYIIELVCKKDSREGLALLMAHCTHARAYSRKREAGFAWPRARRQVFPKPPTGLFFIFFFIFLISVGEFELLWRPLSCRFKGQREWDARARVRGHVYVYRRGVWKRGNERARAALYICAE